MIPIEIPNWLLSKDEVGYLSPRLEFVPTGELQVTSTFCEGYASAMPKGGRLGFINWDGVFAIPPRYDAVEDFCNGYSCVCRDGATGVINRSGEAVFPLAFHDIVELVTDRGCVFQLFLEDGRRMDLVTADKQILKQNIRVAHSSFVYRICDDAGVSCMLLLKREDGRFAFVDLVGQERFQLGQEIVDVSSDMQGGLLPVCNCEGLWGLMDLQGKLTIPYQYQEIYGSDGLWIVCRNGHYGLVDLLNNPILDFTFERLMFASNGLFEANREDKWGIIDVTGQAIFPFVPATFAHSPLAQKHYIRWDHPKTLVSAFYRYSDLEHPILVRNAALEDF